MGLTLPGYVAIASLIVMGIAHVLIAVRFGYLHPMSQKYLRISLPLVLGVILLGSIEARSWQWGRTVIYGAPWIVTLVGGGAWIVLVGAAPMIRRR
ncbi:MAG: hypothetical protein Q7W51_02330 [Coriobacteriia bacterium]|nr:hypothetical protein [Coriobacteriia bacterium]